MCETLITTALCLPALDIEALLQGRMIVAMSESFRNPAKILLCAVQPDLDLAPPEERYSDDFLNAVSSNRVQMRSPTSPSLTIPPLSIPLLSTYAWAEAGACRIYNVPYDLAAIAKLTAWSESYLKTLVQARCRIFLLPLRVHRFTRPIELASPSVTANKAGYYIDLSIPVSTEDAWPILDLESFEKRQQQLFDLVPPLHPELEAFQTALVSVRENSLGAMSLDRDLRYFLGWSCAQETYLYDSDLVWIQQIAQTGLHKSSHDFKVLACQSLSKLGFSNFAHNPEESTVSAVNLADSLITHSTDGAISDRTESTVIFCDQPYALIGKCKAGERGRVASTLTAKLIQFGQAYLSPLQYERSVKLIVAAGTISNLATQAAQEHKMNVIHPNTLQRLTELQAQHPGSIDLLKLKPCLQTAPFGEAADAKINQFIDDILQQLALRATVIRVVKRGLSNTSEESVGVESIYALCAVGESNENLNQFTQAQIYELLIELSSPLVGCLGRLKDDQGRDRFYFLRELHVEPSSLIKLNRL
ncbi:MAG: hypothetical protein DCF15_08920 [Phormidesmis priestleyi]|uniref:DUF1802 domain-containing protein n=1 Tax=Phormidesmis priestleyi TaxID=268141 RepID=A0A2W4XGJ3_9CYAN|nr:MAG: hypothetical protein DCF15_08920 [Phormidesmis priestleyi]